jgi:hypothetical protein
MRVALFIPCYIDQFYPNVAHCNPWIIGKNLASTLLTLLTRLLRPTDGQRWI